MFSYLKVKLSLIIQNKIHCKSIIFHLPLVFLLSTALIPQSSLTSSFSGSHISDCPLIFTFTATHGSAENRQQRFAHLTERCRISVRDLLMLLAILTSSFSSESVYWASWSRLRAQSARLVSSSACTVYGKTRPRGQPLARVKGCRQPHGPNSCVPFKPPKALAPIWHTIFPCQPAHWRTNRGLTCTGTALFR